MNDDNEYFLELAGFKVVKVIPNVVIIVEPIKKNV